MYCIGSRNHDLHYVLYITHKIFFSFLLHKSAGKWRKRHSGYVSLYRSLRRGHEWGSYIWFVGTLSSVLSIAQWVCLSVILYGGRTKLRWAEGDVHVEKKEWQSLVIETIYRHEYREMIAENTPHSASPLSAPPDFNSIFIPSYIYNSIFITISLYLHNLYTEVKTMFSVGCWGSEPPVNPPSDSVLASPVAAT